MKLPYVNDNRVRISSPFGYRTDPITGAQEVFHAGLDLVGINDKTICAPVDGVVIVSQMVTDKTNRTWEWGNYIAINGDDGLIYYLCHLAERTAKVGQKVKAGDPIGIEGSTGYSTGSHCHLEVRNTYNKQINPAELLGIPNEAGVILTVQEEEEMDELDNKPNEWAEEAVVWAMDNGILKGHANGNLALHENATREDMIVFLYRTYQLIKSEK